jgi:hypothetical protein
VKAIYLLLVQEGVLVGEVAEEIVARAFQRRPLHTRAGLSASPKGAPAPSAGMCIEQPDFLLSSP